MVWKRRLLRSRRPGRADPAQHGVEGPDGELVLLAALETVDVVQVTLPVVGSMPGAAAAALNFSDPSGRHRRRTSVYGAGCSLVVDQEGGMKICRAWWVSKVAVISVMFPGCGR
jgi:hypothetical protein